ncbi:hypothetical protein PV05_05056 [Exophiala xenobiotica]|uniref:Uncharacterized protein n=1 Tax=Exophiala xenobiotica TaxID=348802 RepID=A0A0D2BV92_9EURO|nr:uncharacterized protein PV05_05056 [Exophiala xenobiotica]KIW56391.1 hypothetical protein PV05_05056 [Exophiala xenobiotica]
MALDFLSEFRRREGESDIRKARWYIIATSALTAASAGEHIGELYRQITAGLSLEDRKIVQRRIKEAILKGSILYGVPRSATAFTSLYAMLPDDEVDTYSPRMENFDKPGDEQRRAERGRNYFDTLWGGPTGGQAQRDRASKYYPDAGWHLNGLLRHGATKEEAQFAQDLALAVAQQFNVKTGSITKVEDVKL